MESEATVDGKPETADDVLADKDLHGRVVVVTGASGGLGRETARALSSRGAEVGLLLRNAANSADALPDGGASNVVELDLASLTSVRSAADQLLKRCPRIDVLVNNAGVMATPLGRTQQGFELQLGVNHLGHFLLTALLTPALDASSRVVNVTSLGHAVSGMHWDDPHYVNRPYNKWEAYGQSKTANILFTLGLAERGYRSYAVHPGRIATDLYRHLDESELAAMQGRSADAPTDTKTAAQGAATIVWATVVDGIPAGSYLADCEVAMAAPHATDPVEVKRLWSWSEEQVGQRFPDRQ